MVLILNYECVSGIQMLMSDENFDRVIDDPVQARRLTLEAKPGGGAGENLKVGH